MKKLLVICGPTATGKTSLAIKLAKKFSSRGRPAFGWNGELISADSRQVYQGMDIGTGKDHPKTIKIHLIDVVKPNEEFSVAHYYRLAWKEIRRIWKKGKLPILVGGTGFYIRAVVDGIETSGIPRNLEVRAKAKGWSKEKLFGYLTKLDPEKAASMNWSDKNNPRRLIRAIEVAIFRRESSSWQPPKHQKPDSLFIGLTAPYKTLYQRIDERVEKRIKQGVEKEIKRLLGQGYTWEASALGETMGYQEWQPFFEGRKSKEETIQRWKFDEHGYARRQMVWFKKNKRINWFEITKPGFEKKVVRLVKKWYS